jgi:predicted N-acyltransferase
MPDGTEAPALKLYGSIADIPAAAWDACATSDNPFVSHAFLKALEDSGSTGQDAGWIPQHMAFYDTDGSIGAVAPMYAKLHSYGEYVFDQAWAEAFENAGGNYYPKLQICAPFSPVPGPRLLRHPEKNIPIGAISSALKGICRQSSLSSAHVTFCTEDEWKELGQAGWLQRLGMQFHWHNNNYKTFDDFLAALSSKHRKSIRRERRDAHAAGLTFLTLRGDDIKTRHWDAFYKFYMATSDRKWGSAYLTREFFTELSKHMSDKVVLMMAQHDGTLVAGALNLLSHDTLYGRNWGCIGEWPFLHFELCYYRALDFAIEHGLKRVEAGAQGEHKIQRGYLPQLTYSAHFIAHKGLERAVENFLTRERAAIKATMEDADHFSPFRQES